MRQQLIDIMPARAGQQVRETVIHLFGGAQWEIVAQRSRVQKSNREIRRAAKNAERFVCSLQVEGMYTWPEARSPKWNPALMIIRREQMEAFERASAKGFEDRTYIHLQQWFPHQCQLLGEDLIRSAIRYGWRKADRYGLTAECCVRSYIESMCMLGGEFDTDPLLPWAAEILNDRSSSDQTARGDRLYYKMWDYLDHIALDYRDPAGQPATARFMDDLRQLRYGGNESVAPEAMPNFLESLEMRLQRLFPAKCGYLGAGEVRQAVVTGVRSAGAYGIASVRGATLFTCMRFILGGGFDRDLLLPWASATLNDSATRDQYERVDKLYGEGVKFLRRWWEISSQPGGLSSVLG